MRSGSIRSGARRRELIQVVAAVKRRKFVQWICAYVAFAVLALQVVEPLGDIWDWPVPLQRVLTLVLGLGAFPAAIVAWYHGEKGRQRVCLCEIILMAGLAAGSVALITVLAG